MSAPKKGVTLEIETYHEDEPTDCADCGDELVEGDRACWEPYYPYYTAPGDKRAVLVHDYCAVRNGYDLRQTLKGDEE